MPYRNGNNNHLEVPVIGLATVVAVGLCFTVLCQRREDGTTLVGKNPCCSNCANPRRGLPCKSKRK